MPRFLTANLDVQDRLWLTDEENDTVLATAQRIEDIVAGEIVDRSEVRDETGALVYTGLILRLDDGAFLGIEDADLALLQRGA